MTLPAATYDLVLILDLQAEADARAKILADTRAAIEAQGELLRHDEWGERPLAYPIERHASGEYHLLQFHPGDVALLAALDRTLRITDGVLRFRIVKLRPGVPDAPDMRSAPVVKRPDAEAPAESPVGEPPAASEPTPVAASEQPADEIPVGEPA
jgi:small subunit ribosomal protein S6